MVYKNDRQGKRALKIGSQLASLALAAALLAFMMLTASASGGAAACPAHPAHDGSCGYVAEVPGHACAHQHGSACYLTALNCPHAHTDWCYGEEGETICRHEHGEECYTRELDCLHQHDGACGYIQAVPGHACGHICALCARTAEPSPGEEEPVSPDQAQARRDDRITANSGEGDFAPIFDLVDLWEDFPTATEAPHGPVSFRIVKQLTDAGGNAAAARELEQFVYEINYREAKNDPVTRTFFQVVSVQSADWEAEITLVELPAGYYTVTELDGNWRYTLDGEWGVTRLVDGAEREHIFLFKSRVANDPWIAGKARAVGGMPDFD